MKGVVFGCVVPHPPLLVPGIGGGQEARVAATSQAMVELSQELAQSRPDSLVLISPHGTYHSSAMGVLTAPSSRGDLLSWGTRVPEFSFDNDLPLVAALQKEAKRAGVPLKSIGEKSYHLDHGVLVPMHFLREGVKGVLLVPLTFSFLPLSTHFSFGQAIRRAAERLGRRVAVIASGDLSHRLTPQAPAGYDPQGKAFDQKVAKALSRLDSAEILSLDPELIERAGECGLRPIVILLGALEGLKVKPRVLSYEGPFGVGYLVASFAVESLEGKKAAEKLHPIVQLAKDTVASYILRRELPKPGELTPEMRQRAGVFVCLKIKGELRGCIGTFEPTKPNVAEEIIQNAVSSAIRDPRFLPVSADELPHITYSVDVLTKPEPVRSVKELAPKRYGVIVESGGRRGLLLPDLEGVDTTEDQIDICRRKAGIEPDEPVKLYRFEVKRYE